MDKSEEIKARAARYNVVERIEDSYGRLIGVKRLKPSQRIRIEEMAPNLTGEIQMEDADGKMFAVPKIARMIWAASVCEVDEAPIAFPATRRELDSNIDMLEDAGISAAAEGFVKLAMAEQLPEGETAKDMAKNSAPTPSSDRPAT